MLAHRRTGGERGPVVMLHGWAADSRIWGPQLGTHGERVAMFAPDLPGHGRTPLHMDGQRLDAYHSVCVDELCTWAEANDLVEAPIAAWAWGTWVVIDAVASGRLRPQSMMLAAWSPAADVPVPFGGPMSRDWPRYVRMIVRMMVASVISPETEDWLTKIMIETTPAAAAGVHLAGWSPPENFVFPPNSVVVAGDNDRIQPGDEGARMAQGWGVAEVPRIPGVGHTAFVEDKKAFDALFTDWLTKVGVL